MRIRKEYRLVGEMKYLWEMSEKIKYNNLRFDEKYYIPANSNQYRSPYCILTFNISNDMITEVEELLHEIAEKTGVRIE